MIMLLYGLTIESDRIYIVSTCLYLEFKIMPHAKLTHTHTSGVVRTIIGGEPF